MNKDHSDTLENKTTGIIKTMDEHNEQEFKKQQIMWQKRKRDFARKKLEDAWKDSGLAHMNPKAKEVKLQKNKYDTLKEAVIRYLSVFYNDSQARDYDGELIFRGPFGRIKIIPR